MDTVVISMDARDFARQRGVHTHASVSGDFFYARDRDSILIYTDELRR